MGRGEVLPLPKWGAEKVLAMLKGEHNKLRGSFYVVALSFSHMEGGRAKCFGPAIFRNQ